MAGKYLHRYLHAKSRLDYVHPSSFGSLIGFCGRTKTRNLRMFSLLFSLLNKVLPGWGVIQNPPASEYLLSSKRNRYFQQFSLPGTIVYYILKNQKSPGTFRNLSRTCKYIFIKHPIFVIENVYFQKDNINEFSVNSEAKNITTQMSCKFWIINCTINNKLSDKIIEIAEQKIFRINSLVFVQIPNLQLEKLAFLANFVKKFAIFDSEPVDSDGTTPIPVEAIFELLPQLEVFKLQVYKVAW